MIDKFSGRIVYAVLNFGGFLGIGGRHHPLPWDKTKFDPAMGGYLVALDKRKLEGGPTYDESETVAWDDRAWGKRVQDYYQIPPYWPAPF